MAKILIIDDDPDIIKSMKTVLGKDGHEVYEALSGKEGLEALGKVKPDLILLDIMMETMSEGINVAREIKKKPEYEKVPILMLTAIKDKIGFDFKREAGDDVWLPVDDYCEKPLKPQELLDKVKQLLKSK